jgi:hypothetical protein
MAKRPSRSAICKCLEEINAAMKNGSIDVARKYRWELELAASLPSFWGDKQVAAALWNAYDLSGRWVDGVVGVTARGAIDAVEATLCTLSENASDRL